jgi:hypothetical protein
MLYDLKMDAIVIRNLHQASFDTRLPIEICEAVIHDQNDLINARRQVCLAGRDAIFGTARIRLSSPHRLVKRLWQMQSHLHPSLAAAALEHGFAELHLVMPILRRGEEQRSLAAAGDVLIDGAVVHLCASAKLIFLAEE